MQSCRLTMQSCRVAMQSCRLTMQSCRLREKKRKRQECAQAKATEGNFLWVCCLNPEKFRDSWQSVEDLQPLSSVESPQKACQPNPR
ncbi:hypothetical protein PBY51_016499 [Eleginops maclovinus]|uniref:Uncharacterized protein n=1 Tax=Eleginops maclovinus TaxID=56733 RepID=A0AAN7XND9_ELEMC|nr:hypothetical protein PBY51_016499 [Eleginops maclovinus]